MNTTTALILASLSTTVFVGCNKVATKTELSSTATVNLAAEKFTEETPFIVRVQDGARSRVMSMTLEYSGKKGLKKSLKGQRDSVQNLLISSLTEFTYKDLTNLKGVDRFERKLLSSLNEFVAENTFTEVDLLELKGI